jgi:YVTN family beta-propeller protein
VKLSIAKCTGMLLVLGIVLLPGVGCPPQGNNNENVNDNVNNNLNQNDNVNNNENDNADENENENAAATFSGPTHSSTIALTTDDRRLVVVNRETNSVSVFEVRSANGGDTQEKLAEVAVGQEPHSVALSPNNSRAYVTNTASGTVSVIALRGDDAFNVVDEIEVGTEPRGIAITPNGTRLFVANHTAGTVSIIEPGDQNKLLDTVTVGGNPTAIAITNDGDTDDADERVIVTRFYAELIANGSGEGFDDGKQGVVVAFDVNDPDGSQQEITLSPLDNVGFTADRSLFCTGITGTAANDTFCPDVNENNAAADVIAKDAQGAYPNQFFSALIRGNRAFFPNIGAAPEPPVVFNVNVQALVSVANLDDNVEVADEHVNLNAQIKLETQPSEAQATQVLDRLFGNNLVALDADADGENFLIVSQGGNFVIRAKRDGNNPLDIAAPDSVVRFQTGNLPNGVVISSDGTRAYVNNEVGISFSVLDLENDEVIERDVATSQDPEPGTFAHGVLVGKLAFSTALGVPDNGLFSQRIRNIEPLKFRGKQSDNGWSSCTSCHPNGLADGVTWSFATGPRQTISLDAFFAKDNPHDQRLSNFSAIRGFNENSINVQGGKGFAGTPPNPAIYNHGITQGASDALDAQTLWVQTIRAPILPQDADDDVVDAGRDLFAANCASCHGGPKWTKSQILHLDNPAFDAPPVVGSQPRDPGVLNAAAQIVSYTAGGNTVQFLENIGTFDPNNPIEIRSNGQAPLGGLGFNVPSLLGIAYSAPYFHDGSAQTLEEVFQRHELGNGTIQTELTAAQRTNLLGFLRTIDGGTAPFRSESDELRDSIRQ